MTRPDDSMDDFACIDACLNGRTEVFSVLVERYQDRVHALVARMISDREAIGDVAQETFLLAFRGLRSFQRDASFMTWLYRIAFNVCQTERRRRVRLRRIGAFGAGAPDEADAEAETPIEVADDGNAPSDRIEEDERRDLLRAAMAELDEEQRDILVLRDFRSLSYQEIAEILDCPVGTVRSRLFRARAEVRRRLEPMLGGTDR